jgi:CheY-like chemotaxis protein
MVGGNPGPATVPVFPGDQAGLSLAGRFSSGEEAVRAIPIGKTDVALVDFNLPYMDCFECVRRLKTSLPDLPVFVFTSGPPTHSRDEDFIFPALHAGASGYLPGHLPLVEITRAIHQAHHAGTRNRRLFVTFFDSDQRLGRMAKYWEKITTMLNASTVTVHYRKNWRRVMVPLRNTRTTRFRPLVPPVLERMFATR